MLKFLLKAIFCFFILVLGAVAYAVYSYKGKAEDYIKEVITIGAKRSNLNIAFDGFKLNILGAEAKSVDLYLVKAFMGFKVNEPKLAVPIMSVLTMKPGVNFSAKFYEGNIDAQTNYSINSKAVDGWFKITNLNIEKMEQLALLGLAAGDLTLQLDQIKGSEIGPEYFNGSYSLKGLQLSRELQVPIQVTRNAGLQSPLLIPKIEQLDSSGRILFENQKLSFNQGSVDSDLGKATYSANVEFSRPGQAKSISGSAQFNLSDKCMQYFGYLLPEISNNILNENDNKFTLDFSGSIFSDGSHNVKVNYRPEA